MVDDPAGSCSDCRCGNSPWSEDSGGSSGQADSNQNAFLAEALQRAAQGIITIKHAGHSFKDFRQALKGADQNMANKLAERLQNIIKQLFSIRRHSLACSVKRFHSRSECFHCCRSEVFHRPFCKRSQNIIKGPAQSSADHVGEPGESLPDTGCSCTQRLEVDAGDQILDALQRLFQLCRGLCSLIFFHTEAAKRIASSGCRCLGSGSASGCAGVVRELVQHIKAQHAARCLLCCASCSLGCLFHILKRIGSASGAGSHSCSAGRELLAEDVRNRLRYAVCPGGNGGQHRSHTIQKRQKHGADRRDSLPERFLDVRHRIPQLLHPADRRIRQSGIHSADVSADYICQGSSPLFLRSVLHDLLLCIRKLEAELCQRSRLAVHSFSEHLGHAGCRFLACLKSILRGDHVIHGRNQFFQCCALPRKRSKLLGAGHSDVVSDDTELLLGTAEVLDRFDLFAAGPHGVLHGLSKLRLGNGVFFVRFRGIFSS